MVVPATGRGGTSTPGSRSTGVTNTSSGGDSNRSGWGSSGCSASLLGDQPWDSVGPQSPLSP